MKKISNLVHEYGRSMEEYKIGNQVFLGENQPYLRPYLCRGEFSKAKIILAGINPATPIYPSELPLQEYCKLLQDYYSFMAYYKAYRKRENKPVLSRTRQGILSFVQWVEQELEVGVIESDICTYPTKSIKELNEVDSKFQKAGRELFWEMLCKSNANCLIIYGAMAFRGFLKLQEEKGEIIKEKNQDNEKLKEMKIEELEAKSPLFSIWIGKREIFVYAVRHFMYYGKMGASFGDLKRKLFQSYTKR